MIELLIIMLILGVLAAIVVFAVIDAEPQSSRAACQANYNTVETAAQAYKAQVGFYPTQISDLTVQHLGTTLVMDGPWLKESPNVYTPGSPPTITHGGSYGLTIDAATQTIQIGTIKANGAQADSAPVDGIGNCVHA